ncbi:hypothetical protein T07_10142 [Trichinella nelsoni]|uniref:Uncharacterized protein n=1 Tax=Trichinella nelsoni TaxID=6336 RepID=A0A0V0S061_9BILA|nr:hypothetical protein T07_10142 [Trichinella nelsoni]
MHVLTYANTGHFRKAQIMCTTQPAKASIPEQQPGGVEVELNVTSLPRFNTSTSGLCLKANQRTLIQYVQTLRSTSHSSVRCLKDLGLEISFKPEAEPVMPVMQSWLWSIISMNMEPQWSRYGKQCYKARRSHCEFVLTT